jgi:tricorn protease
MTPPGKPQTKKSSLNSAKNSRKNLSPTVQKRKGQALPERQKSKPASGTVTKKGQENIGYYRYATISGDKIVFACEDDLWSVSVGGGQAKRITAGRGECSLPRFSPDGKMIAFVGRAEGHPEVYVMPAEGGLPRRLTYLGAETCTVCGWSKDGKEVLFVSDAQSPFLRHSQALAVSVAGGVARPLNLGHMVYFDIDEKGKTLIGRNSLDPARWKRYRGGTAGDIWIDQNGDGKYKPLLNISGNHVAPMWVAGKVYFLSDHEGIGNLYSCNSDGSQLERLTNHKQYYARFPSTDGKRIVYTNGGDICAYDIKHKKTSKIQVIAHATTYQSQRKFIDSRNYLEHFSLHPEGHSLAVIARGQPVTMGNWEGAVIQHGSLSSGRHRHAKWLNDGKRIVLVNDSEGYERLEIHTVDQSTAPVFLPKLDLGRVLELMVAPKHDTVSLTNHRHELILVDLKTQSVKVLDKSPASRIFDMSWAADGRWLAYSWAPHPQAFIIKVADTQKGSTHAVTKELNADFSPCFDPEGKYLYFLSNRDFHPIYDSLQFDLSFPTSTKPYVVPLRKDVPSPFLRSPKALYTSTLNNSGNSNNSNSTNSSVSHAESKDSKDTKQANLATKSNNSAEAEKKNDDATFEIDFDGINSRVLAFPIDEGRYVHMEALKKRVVFSSFAVRGIRPNHSIYAEDNEVGRLVAYDFEEQRFATLVREVGTFRLGPDNRTLVYRVNRWALRVIDAGGTLAAEGVDPPTPSTSDFSRKSGWVNLSRARILIQPQEEWQQMYEEAWRLQSEQFWDESMSDVDWQLVHDRYDSLLPRIRTRSELSDIMWEMQGELGTSHAYEMGGDYPSSPFYYRGFLGANLSWNAKKKAYRIDQIIRGDSWNSEVDSPLAVPGLKIKEGDYIHAVDGNLATYECSIDELLLNKALCEVDLTVSDDGKDFRHVIVKTLYSERLLRYRNWVENNRRIVHEKSKGKVGYLHIPDMGPFGFAEFHRGYLAEYARDGLIVDVRYNRGGHVSALLLEKLLRKRVGYDVSRWGQPQPYPVESLAGPIVALTNQFAGSDGDIFSHCFKLYKLGPLVGKRTWGGVIGIWPRHRLVDGTITTQPEFSFWFKDVGFRVENYGTDPDFDIDIAPHDYKKGIDPQMDKALELALKELKANPSVMPDFTNKPSLPVPSALRRKNAK